MATNKPEYSVKTQNLFEGLSRGESSDEGEELSSPPVVPSIEKPPLLPEVTSSPKPNSTARNRAAALMEFSDPFPGYETRGGRSGRGGRKGRDGECGGRKGRDGERGGRVGERGGRDGERGGRNGDRGGRDGERSGREGERSGREGDRGGREGGRGGRFGGRGGREAGRGGRDIERGRRDVERDGRDIERGDRDVERGAIRKVSAGPTCLLNNDWDDTANYEQNYERPQQHEYVPRGNRDRGGNFNEFRRGREFDRHIAGTGRGRGVKKSGLGSHNWGGVDGVDQGRDAGGYPTENSFEDAAASTWDDPAANLQEEAANDKASVWKPRKDEGADTSMGLDEYKKLQALKRANLPTLPAADVAASNAAQRNELEREGFTVRVKENLSSVRASAQSKDAHERHIVMRDMMAIEAQAALHESGRRQGGRGGRGRGADTVRGRGPAAGSTHMTPIDVSDKDAFPTLS